MFVSVGFVCNSYCRGVILFVTLMNFFGYINKKLGNSKDFKSLVWIIVILFMVCDLMMVKLDMCIILGDDFLMIFIDDMRAVSFGYIF